MVEKKKLPNIDASLTNHPLGFYVVDDAEDLEEVQNVAAASFLDYLDRVAETQPEIADLIRWARGEAHKDAVAGGKPLHIEEFYLRVIALDYLMGVKRDTNYPYGKVTRKGLDKVLRAINFAIACRAYLPDDEMTVYELMNARVSVKEVGGAGRGGQMTEEAEANWKKEALIVAKNHIKNHPNASNPEVRKQIEYELDGKEGVKLPGTARLIEEQISKWRKSGDLPHRAKLGG